MAGERRDRQYGLHLGGGYRDREVERRDRTQGLYLGGGYEEREVEDPNPYGNHYFALEIKDGSDSVEVAHFMECSGLKSVATVFEFEEGGLNGRTHKRPGQSRWENVVFRYATSASTYLLSWRDSFLQDAFDKRLKVSGSIALKNNHGDVVRRWHFTNAWPVSWEGPQLSATGSELAIETLEIAHDGLSVSDQ